MCISEISQARWLNAETLAQLGPVIDSHIRDQQISTVSAAQRLPVKSVFWQGPEEISTDRQAAFRLHPGIVWAIDSLRPEHPLAGAERRLAAARP